MTGVDKGTPRLVVVPNDPIEDYEQAGYDDLALYFNPTGMFREVVVLSPLEKGERWAFGMHIQGVTAGRFRRTLAELRPDAVRAYGGHWTSDYVCRHRLLNVPVIVSVHDARPELIHPSLRYADLVICVSEVVKERVHKMGVAPHRVRLLPNRVDTKRFHRVIDRDAIESVAARFPPGRHVLHIGRRSREKNLDTLIRALQFLPPEYSCVFVGMGDRTPYIDLARGLDVEMRCFWIDSVKNSDLPTWYSWCDCFCVPSRSEGFGTVFIEAAACGAAIITSHIAPMNEYLTDGASAYLLREYEDPRALAGAIRTVCEDPQYRRRISEGAVKTARLFDREVVDAAEASIYEEVLSSSPLSLTRRLEVTLWRTQEALRQILRRSLGKVARSYLNSRTHDRRSGLATTQANGSD